MEQYGITDVSCDDLRRGVLVGTVEICDCAGVSGAGTSEWLLRDPQRGERVKPQRHPQPVWFRPFDAEGSGQRD